MKKALMIASVASMIDKFNMENIGILEQMGYRVDVAANFEQGSITSRERVEEFQKELTAAGRQYYHVSIPRNIFKINEIIEAYQTVKRLCEENRYDIVHCHSPIGGVIARLAARKSRKTGTRVLYTAHGFHFFRGAPLKNWLVYYPIEWLCSFLTDVLITINQEDYALAKARMCAKRVVYVPGIGLDVEKFSMNHGADTEKRRELGLKDTDKVILSVGELSERKNHEVIIRALEKVSDPNAKYLIGGFGAKEEHLRQLAKQSGLEDNVLLLGYRGDIAELLNITDIYAFPSLQEGLPVALMEAMSVGKAVVCSKIRGNTDLIKDGEGGFLLEPTDVDGFADAIRKLLESDSLRSRMGAANRENIKKFDTNTVNTAMRAIYTEASAPTE